MTRRLFISISLAILLWLPATADIYLQLHSNGRQALTLRVSENLEVKFADSYLYVSTDGTDLRFPLEEIQSFNYHTDNASVDGVQTGDDPVFSLNDELLTVSAHGKHSFRLVTPGGQTLMGGNFEDTIFLPLDFIPGGTLIALIDGQYSFKFLVSH